MAVAFLWRGNDPGLDFLNTELVDARGAPLDLLADRDALLCWAGEAGIVGPDAIEACRRLPRARGAALLEWARRLRAATRALVDPDGGPSAGDAERFSAVVGEIPVRLTVPGDGRPAGVPVAATTPADGLRLALALAAVVTLGLDRSRVRRCEGERCVLLYYDTSRNRSRRWCDMGSCGNRAKAAAHYRRTRRPTAR